MEDVVEIDTNIDSSTSSELKLTAEKSKLRYEDIYKKFDNWRKERNIKNITENVMLVYFNEYAKIMKPTSIWARYSMLKATIKIKDKIDISNYRRLKGFLKRNSAGYKTKGVKTLSMDNVKKFLIEAPDLNYLLMKVVLIFGLSGACMKQELKNIKMSDVEDTGKYFIVNIGNIRTKEERKFVINDKFYDIIKKYCELRPAYSDKLPFFIKYANGRCCRQVIGINQFGSIPRKVAEFLKLPDAREYTGHCFRKTALSTISSDDIFIKQGTWRRNAEETVTSAGELITSTIKVEEPCITIGNSSSTSLDQEIVENNNENNSLENITIKTEEPIHSIKVEEPSVSTENSVPQPFRQEIIVTNADNTSESITLSNLKPTSIIFKNCTVAINNYYSNTD